MKISIISYNLEELQKITIELGEPKFRAKQLHEWIYKKLVFDFSKMQNLSSSFREKLSEKYQVLPFEEAARLESKDGTIKFVLRCNDGELIETVFIPSEKRRTICISSQVGCAVGCIFCASGKNGLVRNLREDEILGQVAFVANFLGIMPTNLVAMGIGEPLLNPHFTGGMKMLCSPDFFDFGARNVTISSSGIVPQMYKLADEKMQWNLAVSIHATTDENREKIIPTNLRFPLREIINACLYYREKTTRKISFEFTMIKNVNDSFATARELAVLAKKAHAKINLIPLNCTELDNRKPNNLEIKKFVEVLEDSDAEVTVRYSRGEDIAAACGQLRNQMSNQTFD